MTIFSIVFFAITYICMFILISFIANLGGDAFPLKKPWRGIALLLWPISMIVFFIYVFIMFLIDGFVKTHNEKQKEKEEMRENHIKAAKELYEIRTQEQEMVPKEALVWMIEVYQTYRPDDSYGPYDTEGFIEIALAQGEGYDEFGEKIERGEE